MATARRVKLTASSQSASGQGSRLVVVASDPNLMPAELFVLRRALINVSTGATADRFDHVASPAELGSLPVGAPAAPAAVGLFRSATLDETYANETTALSVWESVQTEAARLKDALDAADALADLGFVWIGQPPP